jgi:glucose-1-phosphate adenylyltransferase
MSIDHLTSNVLAVIMGGGAGTRLFPLTKDRAKPAVPIGGKYRLVDIPISNCINSDIRQMYILTQFNSASLHRHIHSTYAFDRFTRGFVEILAAQQTISGSSWYQGTADAVRQNLRYFLQSNPKYILILSGDQLYHLDFRLILEQHIANKAAISIATIPVPRKDATSLGIMELDADKRIIRFAEKPKDTSLLDQLRIPATAATSLSLPGGTEWHMASMGIYLFNTDILVRALDNDKTDFGKHIIPDAIYKERVFAYTFQGYWEDVGTIKSFYDANLAMCSPQAPFNFFERNKPVYTHARFLPPSKILNCQINESLVADGCILLGSHIERTVIGLRSFIGAGCHIRNSIVMGCDFFGGNVEHRAENDDKDFGIPHASIGRNCQIDRAIIDKNVHLGDGVVITDKTGHADVDGPNYYIRDGIVIIPKNTFIPNGTKI